MRNRNIGGLSMDYYLVQKEEKDIDNDLGVFASPLYWGSLSTAILAHKSAFINA
jgi:hypothetical protein